jgi:hypothetical protein
MGGTGMRRPKLGSIYHRFRATALDPCLTVIQLWAGGTFAMQAKKWLNGSNPVWAHCQGRAHFRAHQPNKPTTGKTCKDTKPALTY